MKKKPISLLEVILWVCVVFIVAWVVLIFLNGALSPEVFMIKEEVERICIEHGYPHAVQVGIGPDIQWYCTRIEEGTEVAIPFRELK